MMMIKKKTLLITSLVFLLIIVSYINHQLNKQSFLESSNEYYKHEENELNKIEAQDNNTVVETTSENITKEQSSNLNSDNDVSKLSNKTDNTIEKTISLEQNRKSENYFVEYRLSRDKLRASLIERLYIIIENEKTTEEVRTIAQKEILRIGSISENELYIEGLIKGKGFEDVLVFLKENSARVIVDIKQLTEQDVMKIYEIVQSETNIEPVNIKIMKKF